MTWEQTVSVVALVVALAALVVGIIILGKIRERGARVAPLTRENEPAPQDGTTPEEEPAPPGPAAFVLNPIKADGPALRRRAAEIAADLAMPEPLWFETTVEDPGVGQTRAAIAAGASVVVAAGGDGTVRTVAEVLAGTEIPMALLPLGTGNLLARNLDLPLASTELLIHTALGGVDHSIDLGWIRAENVPVSADDAETTAAPADGGETAPAEDTSPAPEHLFLVMAGIGFDAQMVAGAGDELKARMGWFAYFLAGARHLHGRKTRLQMQVGEGEVRPLQVRSLLFANCGRLPGGIVLLPDAELDDGWLDVAALDTRGGVLGWASLFGKVVLQGLGIRRQLPAPSSIEFWRGREMQVISDRPDQVQVDGDLIGEANRLSVRVQASGLRVRTR
ncbi:diacylglycerol/lipid kinase family protein [Ruania zhangjianzhongii]|uniref:diacylglycerol/lipid kinase family protein n=1 Tax=Ruania zhangjianzhongii TaxID=2603206 RepID=UPI0011C722DB|nr:diacylglycerol kinase family protein [Ruania zhangjianzhongii]